MSELNNFRVVINLSNFFSDHRHRARIFINKNIKTIQALHDRVSQIFGINNFHLTSQNEFLPPSEDVRVLKNDEVLWAMPSSPDTILEQSQLEVEKKDESEQKMKLNSSGKVAIGDKPKKRKKSQLVVEEITIEDALAEPLEKKKKKKSKKKDKIPSVEECSSVNKSDVTLMAGTEESETGSKSEMYDKASPTISFGGSSSNAPLFYKKNKVVPLITDQYLKKKKVNIVKIDFVAGSLDSLKELKLKEIQKLANEWVDDVPKTEQKQCAIPANSAGDEKNVDIIISSNSEENTLTSESKLKVDAGNSKQNDFPVPLSELIKKPPKVLPKPKFFKTPNWRKQVSSLNIPIPFEEIPVVQIITATASTESENLDKPVSEQKAEVAVEEIPEAENASAAQNFEPEKEHSLKISQATEASPACASYIEMSSTADKETLQTSFEISGIPLNGSEAAPCEMGKTENGSLEISGVHRIHTGGSLKPFKKISGVGTLLEGLRASTSSTSLDTTCETETSEFVTRRVRKRNRKRQKKSHDSTDYTDQAMETYQPRPMNVKGSPAIHIKFSEDEQIDDAIGPVEAEGSKCVSMNGSKTILIESENDEVQVKEKDIFKSPLMTNLLPKAGDVIAFKVLKLSDDYMPEMSTHIIAKVLSFNGDSKCVNLQILGGLDQCQDPEGKFSMDFLDSYEATKSRNRVYLWTDLIEPRLMFP